MVLPFLAPRWFFGYDIVLELLFSIISFMVAMFAFKMYKKTSQKSVKLFGISFLLIAISYLIQTLLNFMILSKINEEISRMMKLYSISAFNYAGAMVHIFFMTLGLAILTYTILKTDSKRTFWLLIILPLLGVFLSANITTIFYLFATVFLIFIAGHYIGNCLRKKKGNSLLVGIAFMFLLLGNIHFLFLQNHAIFYVLGHILEFFAYLLILINLISVSKWRKGKNLR